jgi:hypothetical protein
VPGIFLDFGTEEYSSVIFLGIEEYDKTKVDTLFSCSVLREGDGSSEVGNNLTSQEEKGVVAERMSWLGGGWGGVHLDGEAAKDIVGGFPSI